VECDFLEKCRPKYWRI